MLIEIATKLEEIAIDLPQEQRDTLGLIIDRAFFNDGIPGGDPQISKSNIPNLIKNLQRFNETYHISGITECITNLKKYSQENVIPDDMHTVPHRYSMIFPVLGKVTVTCYFTEMEAMMLKKRKLDEISELYDRVRFTIFEAALKKAEETGADITPDQIQTVVGI